jgi:hypothetical protein
MLSVTVAGNDRTGSYTGGCECGSSWSGSIRIVDDRCPSPAMPVAEAMVHAKLEHRNEHVDMHFTVGFVQWLMQFWAHETQAQAREWVK